jgi:DNA-binding NtrC family response regulator
MNNIYILCIEDEPEVLEAVIRDLAPFEEKFPIESASNVSEARQVVNEVILKNGKLGLVVCDHIMPGEDGVSFLVSLEKDERTQPSRKVLLTAQAGLQATIEAVNKANLSHYIAKPWKADALQEIAKRELTEFVLKEETDLIPFMTILDAEKLGEKIREQPSLGDE